MKIRISKDGLSGILSNMLERRKSGDEMADE